MLRVGFKCAMAPILQVEPRSWVAGLMQGRVI